MDEIIAKRLSNYQTIKPHSLTDDHEQYSLKLRKARLESQILKRRLGTMKTNYSINLSNLDIPPELKAQDFISKTISSESYEEIFSYINEIYNTTNYHPNLFKYGLFLLKHKLLDESSTDKNIPALIQIGFFDIPKKIFQYAQTQIDKEHSGDIEDLIYDLYWILLNFSYYATEEENKPLIAEDYLSYHYFLLKNESDDSILSSIITLLANIASHSYNCSSIIIEYRGEDLFELMIQYISSGITRDKFSIVSASSDLLSSYISTIQAEKPKEIKETVIEKIFNVFVNLVFFKSTFHNSMEILSIISEVFPLIFNSILNHLDVFTAMMSFNYKDDSESLVPFIKIIRNLFEYNSNNEGKFYNELYSLLEMNLIEFITILIQDYAKMKKMKKKVIKAIHSLCICDKRFIAYVVDNNKPLIALLIEMLQDPHYSIKEKVLEIFNAMTIIDSFSINSSLVTHGLMQTIANIIKPELTSCLDCNILLKCLSILNGILLTADWIKKINSINSFATKFEAMGGRDSLEHYLGHPNKEVYLASQMIIDAFYS